MNLDNLIFAREFMYYLTHHRDEILDKLRHATLTDFNTWRDAINARDGGFGSLFKELFETLRDIAPEKAYVYGAEKVTFINLTLDPQIINIVVDDDVVVLVFYRNDARIEVSVHMPYRDIMYTIHADGVVDSEVVHDV